VFELLPMNDHVRGAIHERRSSGEIRQAAQQTGMIALREDALRKVLSGTTTLEEVLRAVYLDERGQERPIVMGSYGIGPARIAAAAIEQRHDADGIVWPWSIAPCHVHVLPVNVNDRSVRESAEQIYRELGEAGFEALLDDRDERPGVKFKDADLLGVPIRVTVGALLAREGRVEVRSRRDKRDVRVAPAEVVATVRDLARRLADSP